MTLSITHRLALQQQAARRVDDLTDARDRLEADPQLQAWADRWWSELEPDALTAWESLMIVRALADPPVRPVAFIENYRRLAYVQTGEFDTLVSDVADGEQVSA